MFSYFIEQGGEIGSTVMGCSVTCAGLLRVKRGELWHFQLLVLLGVFVHFLIISGRVLGSVVSYVIRLTAIIEFNFWHATIITITLNKGLVCR